MAELSTDVQYIKGIGPQRAKALQKVGVTTLEDLVSYFPRSYEDRREVCTIAQLQPGQSACVRAMDAENALLLPCREAISQGRRVTAREIMGWRNEMQRRRAAIANRD